MNKLKDHPTDGISCIRFAPKTNTLAASSWDSTLYFYTLDSFDCIQTYKSRGPILCCDFTSDESACSGGLDKDVKLYDLRRMEDFVIGKHNEAVSCIRYASSKNCVISGSWDGTLSLWNANERDNSSPLQSMSVRHILSPTAKVYAMDVGEKLISEDALRNSILAVATNTLQVVIYDIRQLQQPIDIRDTRLGYCLRSIHLLPDENGYAVGSVEGRVSIDFLSSTDPQDKPFCFKCHRKVVDGVEKIFPVNAITVHPLKSCLVTGGSDGFVTMWDYRHRRRIAQIDGFPTSISSLAFNSDGSQLAIASSYLYENGKLENTPNEIYIKPIDKQTVFIHNDSYFDC